MKNHPLSLTLVAAALTFFSPSAQAADKRGCVPDPTGTVGFFTSPPTDIANAADVIPLGNLNPGGGHTIAVDHMYIEYPGGPIAPGETPSAYNVLAMKEGKLFLIFRKQNSGRPDFDYQLFIGHTCSIASYVDHLHELDPVISGYIAANSVPWQSLTGSPDGPWILFLGQPAGYPGGGVPMLSVAAGQVLGKTKNYSNAWDVGVVDQRFSQALLEAKKADRYPDFASQLPQFPSVRADISVYPFLGNLYVHAACFIDYLDAATASDWTAVLASIPQGCGKSGWDVHRRLRGEWFNPSLDVAPGGLNNNETAALSIVPSNRAPDTEVQIGIGNAAGASVPSLAALDPGTAPEVSRPFTTAFDPDPAAIVNPDPQNAQPGQTYCYDLPYNSPGGSFFDYLLVQLDKDGKKILVKYSPSSSSDPLCSTLRPLPAPDLSWKTYIR
jgi:hypothetical protein